MLYQESQSAPFHTVPFRDWYWPVLTLSHEHECEGKVEGHLKSPVVCRFLFDPRLLFLSFYMSSFERRCTKNKMGSCTGINSSPTTKIAENIQRFPSNSRQEEFTIMAILEIIIGAWPQAPEHRAIISFVVAVLFPFLFTWMFTSLQSLRAVTAARRAAPGNKRPPTLPTIVPFIGHVLRFSFDGHKFLFGAVYIFSSLGFVVTKDGNPNTHIRIIEDTSAPASQFV